MNSGHDSGTAFVSFDVFVDLLLWPLSRIFFNYL